MTRLRAVSGGCRVTIYHHDGRRPLRERCNQPVTAGKLCAQHEADRIRLGGRP